jgi:hypothetical protein
MYPHLDPNKRIAVKLNSSRDFEGKLSSNKKVAD